jgi:TonB family protein
MRNEHGVALVNLSMDRSGNVLSVRLLNSSGSATLDEEAQAVVRRCLPRRLKSRAPQ